MTPVSPDSQDKYDEDACSVIDSLEQIGSQWRLIVLHDLQEGEKRFNELKRSTDASSRTLSRVLDDLQELGFVNRRLEEDAPVATYYSLTPKGRSLCPVFDEIESWADEWLHATPTGEDPAAVAADGGSTDEATAAGANDPDRTTESESAE
ncbi:winged helix-turn-helix transcriptional regulator [Halobellus limi]|uniref:Transcriptional regulator, HxlR family n=1 Tax=Halobellus limi TaxID=699433 RepID=A0A1H5VAU3_9EURY|nr:transcriptional regulator, HxlR family [Halobellus limi]